MSQYAEEPDFVDYLRIIPISDMFDNWYEGLAVLRSKLLIYKALYHTRNGLSPFRC